jgi:hypothetical protein
MLSQEQARQLGCVVRKVKSLMEGKAKGSIIVHLDGSGGLGKQFETHLFEWRDNHASWGQPLDEETFCRILIGGDHV